MVSRRIQVAADESGIRAAIPHGMSSSSEMQLPAVRVGDFVSRQAEEVSR